MKDYSNYYIGSNEKILSDGDKIFQLNLQGFDGVDVLVNGKPEKVIISEKYSVKENLNKVIAHTGILVVGDLINFESMNWLVRKLDKKNQIFDTFTMEISPSTIKWLDGYGEIQEYNFIFNSDNLSNFGVEDGRVISLPNDRRNIAIRSTPQTKAIKIHQRFIFDQSAWRVISINRLNPLVEMVLESDTIDLAKDNIELRIADYIKPNYSIQLDQTSISLKVGDTFSPSVTITNNGTPLPTPTFSFVSSDSNICTVDELGLITAISDGQVTVTVEYKGIYATIDVTVSAVENHNYSVTINGDSTITKSKSKPYSYVFYDNGIEADISGSFKITDLNNNPTASATIISQSGNSCTVRGDSIGYVLLHVVSDDGLISSSKQIQIKSAI